MWLPISCRLTLAAKLDRFESIIRRVGERVGWPQSWLQEFIAFQGDPRLTLEEFYVRFTLKRMAAEPTFAAVKTEADAPDCARACSPTPDRTPAHRGSDYMLW